MFKIKTICKRLGVPFAAEKTEGLVKSMKYFGLTRHTESMSVKIPEETISTFPFSRPVQVSLFIFTIGTTPQRYQYKVLNHN
jgi:hypothetical protein